MKNSLKISVLMSVFNGQDFLAEAIESILSQTFKDFEFIIINDGSSDHSIEIIDRYKKIDKRIIVKQNLKNIGLPAALNIGISMANTKYIARQDSDDRSKPKRLEKQVKTLEDNESITLLGTLSEYINTDGSVFLNCCSKRLSISLQAL